MSVNKKFITKDEHMKDVDPSLDRSMIGSVLYLTASRPNFCFNVGVCAIYQASPKESHITAVKHIIRYISSTVEFGIWYFYDLNIHLAGYINDDWAGNIDD